jgi:RNA polymerase sigma factor (TIGR02999 family)
MRRILVDKARRKKSQRHGGERQRVELLDIADTGAPDDQQILLLDDALTRLAAVRPQAAQIVQLRFFSGCTLEEAASFLDVSERTARRLWVFARAWLRREMQALAKRNA